MTRPVIKQRRNEVLAKLEELASKLTGEELAKTQEELMIAREQIADLTNRLVQIGDLAKGINRAEYVKPLAKSELPPEIAAMLAIPQEEIVQEPEFELNPADTFGAGRTI